MKKIISVLLVTAILCSMVVLSAAAESGSATRIIVDCMDREVEIPETVESIVCVGLSFFGKECYLSMKLVKRSDQN